MDQTEPTPQEVLSELLHRCHILGALLKVANDEGVEAAASIRALLHKTIADAGDLCRSLVGVDAPSDV
jgi:hypothetical protein